MAKFGITRRRVLIGTGALGVLIGVGGYVATRPGPRVAGTRDETGAFLHDWLHIGTDGLVTVRTGFAEMGQGAFTGVATLIAEELGCRLDQMKVETGPASDAFKNIAVGREILSRNRGLARGPSETFGETAIEFVAEAATQQITGGSSAMQDRFFRARQVGAVAREMLIAAAARRWGVPAAECAAAEGRIRRKDGKSFGFGDLALAALAEKPPERVELKPSENWTLIGKRVQRVDAPAKVDGSAVYGIDVRRPDMLFAAIANCPTFGGKLLGFDDAKTKTLPGVVTTLAVPGGVAVVADSTWRAKRGLGELKIDWDLGPAAKFDSAAAAAALTAAIGKGKSVMSEGDAAKTLAAASKRIVADYDVPYLAHAPMEPMNCTAEYAGGRLEIWAPTQAQTLAVQKAAKATGVAQSDVVLHTPYLGGGFGRRLEADFVEQAAVLAKTLGRPVQAHWSREEDMTHDFYRPCARLRLEAGVDAEGRPLALQIAVATQSILARVFPPATWFGPDETQVHGIVQLDYAIPVHRTEVATIELPVPVGSWRSVGHSYAAFAKESFIDELAAAAGVDPFEYRLKLLVDRRSRSLLEELRDASGWGKPLPKGEGRGVALHTSFGTMVAEVVEVAVDDKQGVRVKRVVAAVDCGVAVNPDVVKAQVEGGIIFALSAAMFGKVTLRDGRVEQQSFPDYEMIRMAQAPKIEVILHPGADVPGGIGEPGVPPLAPALANAIFAATGRRVRSLPLKDQGYSTV